MHFKLDKHGSRWGRKDRYITVCVVSHEDLVVAKQELH